MWIDTLLNKKPVLFNKIRDCLTKGKYGLEDSVTGFLPTRIT